MLKNEIAIVWKRVANSLVTMIIRVSRGQLTRDHATNVFCSLGVTVWNSVIRQFLQLSET